MVQFVKNKVNIPQTFTLQIPTNSKSTSAKIKVVYTTETKT